MKAVRLITGFALLLSAAQAVANPFLPGNIVILRTGDGASQPAGTTKPVSLLEINPLTGATVQTITLPMSGGTALTLGGPQFNGDGYLSRSADGTTLGVLGRNVAAGFAPTTACSVASVSASGAVTVNTFPTLASNALLAGALPNGSQYYLTTASSTGPALSLATSGTSGAPTTLNNTTAGGLLNPQIYNGQLYAISGNSAVARTTPALPTSSGTTVTNIAQSSSLFANGFIMLDRNAGVAGVDTLYIAGDGGLEKFSFNGTTWTKQGTTLNGIFFGITATVNGSNADIYLTTGDGTASGGTLNNKVQRITDTAAFNAPISGSLSDLAGLGTSGANNSYMGIVFAPVPVPVVGSIAVLACLAIARRQIIL